MPSLIATDMQCLVDIAGGSVLLRDRKEDLIKRVGWEEGKKERREEGREEGKEEILWLRYIREL